MTIAEALVELGKREKAAWAKYDAKTDDSKRFNAMVRIHDIEDDIAILEKAERIIEKLEG